MALKKIFNADDFGMSRGVNQAIAKAYHEGVLNSTSIMINLNFVDEALELKKNMPDLAVGLHLNLTNQYPLSNPTDIPLLVDDKGKFKNGFVNLLLLSFLHPKELRRQVELETRAQLEKVVKSGLTLSHIDSHRHIHHIPLIFNVVKKLAAEYGIPRIRVVNENVFNTLKHNKDNSYLKDGGLVKYAVLRALAFWNNYKTDTYFYSILYTCKLSREKFNDLQIPKGYAAVEIGIHPAMPEVDRQHPEDVFDDNILSPWRTKELETLLDKTMVDEIK